MTLSLPTQPDLSRLFGRVGTGPGPFLALTALCLLLWLPGFFSLPPSDRDEARFAQATKQMIETGNHVQIRNGLVARNQKPIGIYWLQLPFVEAAQLLGISRSNPIWPYRIPSLLGGLIAVLATYGFGRRLVGSPAALLGAAFLAASIILTAEVHIAKTDAALLGATTLAMGLLARAWLNPAAFGRVAAVLFWAALGVGILIKGPIAPVVCGFSVLWLMVVDRAQGPPLWLAALRARTGVPVLLAIVLPWCVAIGLATHGGFFAQSVGGDLVGKLVGGDDAHGAPFGLHLALMPFLLFGGGIAAVAAIPSVWRSLAGRETRFLIAWVLPGWIVFELVPTKLPHYTLPLYPAIALLAARWMLSPPERVGGFARLACTIGVVVTGVVGLAAAALPFVAQGGVQRDDLLGLPTLAIAAVLGWLLIRAFPDARRAALLMLCAAPLLYGSLLGGELPALRALWIAPQVVAALRRHWPDGAPAGAGFGALDFAEPSLMFLCGTETRLFSAPEDAARFLLADPDNVLLVTRDERHWLTDQLRRDHATAAAFGEVRGYNYSRGQRVHLTLLTGGQRVKE